MSATTTYAVTGMTCGHCGTAIKEEVGQLTGVTAVDVDLHADGTSQVTVTIALPLPAATVRDAVDEAGYLLAG